MMEKSTVIIIQQKSYNENTIYEKFQIALKSLGGLEALINKNDKILVKPNFLTTAEPDSGIVTHPDVIRAVLRLLQEEGYTDVQYGDSCGHGTCPAAAEKLGLKPENTYSATLARMDEEILVPFPEGAAAKEFYFAKEIVEADSIINICKMKTHALENISGAVKNVYGFICGKRKAAGHVKYPNASVFARMLADIHRFKAPKLNIMDGIVAMEGNGPSGGTPIPMNVLLISTDPVALDTVFCHMVSLEPDQVPTCVQGQALGIGTMNPEEIRLLLIPEAQNPESESATGLPYEITFQELEQKLANHDFRLFNESTDKSWLAKYSKLMTRLQKKPFIDNKSCVKCGICVEHCPVPGKAISFSSGRENPPVYDYKKCIRCYCCQEMCPKHAIKVRFGR